MAKKAESRGNKPLVKLEPLSNPDKIRCESCNKTLKSDMFYPSRSRLFRSTGRIPYCEDCLASIYDEYVTKYTVMEHPNPRRKAMERICMMTDKYYGDKLFDSAMKERDKECYKKKSLVYLYMKQTNLFQYSEKDFDTTVQERYLFESENGLVPTTGDVISDRSDEELALIEESKAIFGKGFSEEDYLYLLDQYKDWTTRHECNTKAQEEVFKRLCFVQLDLLKATRRKEPTKDLDATFQNLLGTANLQPKQNSKDAVSDAQTFGTLIDKWENTRPLPEIDEELKDVDKIGLYIDVFFRGHTARMLGVKNALSGLYDKFMRKYTVVKPEYKDDDDNEALFNAIFGSSYEDGD